MRRVATYGLWPFIVSEPEEHAKLKRIIALERQGKSVEEIRADLVNPYGAELMKTQQQ
jgi:hypothetical protein